MKVTREKTENRQAYLTVEMEPAELEESLKEAYEHLVQKARIPGFRKGKAPRSVLERHIGREGMVEEALHHMIPEAYEKVLKEQEIEPIAQPEIEIVQTEPVIFKAVVPLMPTIELGDYKSVRVEPEKVEVKDEQVDAVLEEMRHQNAIWEPVERAVNFGDLAVMDVESNIEGKPFIQQKGTQYEIVKDYPVPLAGFAEQLVGMTKGSEKEFTLKIPETYPRKELVGKEVAFKVKVSEVKEEKLPELNDGLAAQISPELKTVAALREEAAAKLKARAEELANNSFEDKAIQAVVDVAKIEIPPVMVEEEINHMLNDQVRRLQWDARQMEAYLKSVNKTGPQLREEVRPQAAKRLSTSLVLGKVAEAEKIEVTDADIDGEIEKMTKTAGEKEREALQKMFQGEESRNYVKQLLMTRKTIARIVEIAKSTEIKGENK
ncbi:MAG: trigger factor [Dehalococcoidales bacterium]|nr:trigger factor [Dehalococcoidales bacterium]